MEMEASSSPPSSVRTDNHKVFTSTMRKKALCTNADFECRSVSGTTTTTTFTLAPFLCKTYDIVDNPVTDVIISWTPCGRSFVVWDPYAFSVQLLPRFFKHSNFSSFVRQLNTYGFRKVDPNRWEFANEGFVRGHKDLLHLIHRGRPQHHKSSHTNTASYSANQGMSHEETDYHDSITREENLHEMEIIRLKKFQKEAEEIIRAMSYRLHSIEQWHRHILNFLCKALQKPSALMAHQNTEVGCLPTLDATQRNFPCTETSESPILASKQISGQDKTLEFWSSDSDGDIKVLVKSAMEESVVNKQSSGSEVVEEILNGSHTSGLHDEEAAAYKQADKICEKHLKKHPSIKDFGSSDIAGEDVKPHVLERLKAADVDNLSWEQFMVENLAEGGSEAFESHPKNCG